MAKRNPLPVIFVPGIQGSTLFDYYRLDPDRVWDRGLPWDDTRRYDRVALHPDDLQAKRAIYENAEPALIRPVAPLDIAYSEFIGSLRSELPKRTQTRTRYGDAVPVYPFAYDWRQPLALTVERLGEFVAEVLDRTKLTEHYATDEAFMKDPRVSLVGHSMGGLVVYGYLASTRGRYVGKLVTAATPFQGSPFAVERMTVSRQQPAMREVARVTPGVYHLLPSYRGAIEVERADAFDGRKSVFNPNCWQRSIKDAIHRYVHTHGLGSRQDKADRAERMQKELLDQARRFRALTDDFDLSTERDASGKRFDPADFLFIAGVGQETYQSITVRGTGSGVWFDLGDELDDLESMQTGDDTVPYRSAAPKFVDVESPRGPWAERVARVSPRSMSWWREAGDRALVSSGGLHAVIMNVDAVQRVCASHLEAEPGERGWIHRKSLDGVDAAIGWSGAWKAFRSGR